MNKEIRICLEIQGLVEDENGKPCPGGLCVTLVEDTDPEPTAEEYAGIVKKTVHP